MSLKPIFKIFAALILVITALSEPTEINYLRNIMTLVAISIFMQEDGGANK
mgnify:CR=1 FL=1